MEGGKERKEAPPQPTIHAVKLPQRGSSLQATSPTSPVSTTSNTVLPQTQTPNHRLDQSAPSLSSSTVKPPVYTHQKTPSQSYRGNLASSAPILNVSPPNPSQPPSHSLQSSASFNSAPSTAGLASASNTLAYPVRVSSDIPRGREAIPLGFPGERSRVGSVGTGDLTLDTAWQAICAKVLPLFNGEGLKGSIEDLNELVSIWVNEMLIQQINPIQDIRELLAAGMLNLGNRIVTVGDEALTLRLVELWSFFFGTVVPYVQGVFLPIRTRYRLHIGNRPPGKPYALDIGPEVIDIRNMALITFRDMIIIPMASRLEALFPRILIDVANDRRLQDISSRLIHMLSILLNASSAQGIDDRAKRCKDLLIFLKNTLIADAEDAL
ncbi:hypothetical protein HDU97_000064 [Phlyctochytrium planicorne]|nr:hypothetical protein HDU97_000064 [Phlyctochytrium planicorne]